MKLYVGTYAKYNNGSLEGAWLDLSDYASYEDFMDACRELHSDEGEPELMFQDHEDMEGFYSECSVDPDIWELLEEDEDTQKIIKAYISYCGSYDSLSDIIQSAKEHFYGSYDCEEAFAYDFANDTGLFEGCNETVKLHFNYESYANELFSTDFCFVDGFVFFNR